MIAVSLYIFAEAVLLAVIKIMDASQPYAVVGKVEYAAILFSFLVTAVVFLQRIVMERARYTAPYQRETRPFFDRHGIFIGMLFTLMADTFLVLLESLGVPWADLPGVLTFCVVQTVYAVYLDRSRPVLIARLAVFAGVTALLFALHMFEPVNIAAGWSIVWLTGNVIVSFLRAAGTGASTEKTGSLFMNTGSRRGGHKVLSAWFFFAGLLLFLCCDLSVGIYNLTWGVAGMETVSAVFYFLIWMFYLPSQVLIPLSYLFN